MLNIECFQEGAFLPKLKHTIFLIEVIYDINYNSFCKKTKIIWFSDKRYYPGPVLYTFHSCNGTVRTALKR